MRTILSLGVFLALALPSFAFADHWRDHDEWRGQWRDRERHDWHPDEHYRYHRESHAPYFSGVENRIDSGIHRGQISRSEESELRQQQRDLRQREYAYRNDGYLSRGERDDLQDRQHDLEKKLDHELHDGEKRSW